VYGIVAGDGVVADGNVIEVKMKVGLIYLMLKYPTRQAEFLLTTGD
jgi:hypothetical protein